MKRISSGIQKKDTTALNLYLLFFFFLLCHKHGELRDSTREDPIVLPTEWRRIFLCCLRAGQAELHKQSQAKFRRQSVSVQTIRLQLFPLFVYIHLNSCGAVVAHSTVTCMKHKLSGSDLLKFSLIPWMKSFEKKPWKKWSVLKRPYTWSKRTRKNQCEQSLI